jgi:hypothetical protein
MFNIFVKPSAVHVDCFTDNATAFNNFKVDAANKFYPAEFKRLPNKVNVKINHNPNSKLEAETPTVRMCNGITDLFSNGFILPSWEKFSIEITEHGEQFSHSNTAQATNTTIYHHHDRIQYGFELFKNWTHAKLLSPWLMEEKSGIKFTWNMCDYHRTDIADVFKVLPAVIDYKYQIQTHVNCFIKNGNIITIEAGDPLVQMIPLTEKKVKLHHHLLSTEDWIKKQQTVMVQTTYHNHRKLNLPDAHKSKCPFGFGK